MQHILRIVSLLLYGMIVFCQKERTDFWLYFWGASILFAIYIYSISYTKWRIFDIIIWAFLFRIIFIFYLPVLSDDVYRFIWDGFLILNGENPYQFLPSELHRSVIDGLYQKLNSPNYFSVYPPLNQYFFAIGVFLGKQTIFNSIVAIRGILLLSSFVNLFLIYRICQGLNFGEIKTQRIVALYALNPLVIIETVGNLHFEGLMLSLLLASYYVFLKYKNFHVSAIFFGLAVSIKLVPLILLPLIWYKLRFSKGLTFVLVAFSINLLLFLPFLDLKLLVNIFSSAKLYFQSFEFNASIYYLLREIGLWLFGFNLIQFIGPFLGLVSFILILRKSFSGGTLIESGLFIFFTYLLCSTTVHPWYLILLFGISLFTNYRFPLVWTFTASLSYYAYRTDPPSENLFFIALEYLPVLYVMIWELRNKRAFFWANVQREFL